MILKVVCRMWEKWVSVQCVRCPSVWSWRRGGSHLPGWVSTVLFRCMLCSTRDIWWTGAGSGKDGETQLSIVIEKSLPASRKASRNPLHTEKFRQEIKVPVVLMKSHLQWCHQPQCVENKWCHLHRPNTVPNNQQSPQNLWYSLRICLAFSFHAVGHFVLRGWSVLTFRGPVW